jgi:hypothetical protein
MIAPLGVNGELAGCQRMSCPGMPPFWACEDMAEQQSRNIGSSRLLQRREKITAKSLLNVAQCFSRLLSMDSARSVQRKSFQSLAYLDVRRRLKILLNKVDLVEFGTNEQGSIERRKPVHSFSPF